MIGIDEDLGLRLDVDANDLGVVCVLLQERGFRFSYVYL